MSFLPKIAVPGALLFGIAILGASGVGAAPTARAFVTSAPFGTLPGGETATLYTLRNARGAQVQITNYGGIVTSLRVPDRQGRLGDVVLGYSNLQGYLNDEQTSGTYFGTLVGRYANRIAKGQFRLDGRLYRLDINNPPNHLHGGYAGWSRRLWQARPLTLANGTGIELRLVSLNGDGGFPGTVRTRVRYEWNNQNQLRIIYRATTDRATPIVLTHHSYFNLAGAGSGTILGHQLRLNASRFTPIDKTSIPLGYYQSVAGTPFDFRRFHTIGERINQNSVQLRNGAGYDHNFVLDHPTGRLDLAVTVFAPASGREMRVYTTEPCIQLYTGNFLTGINGKNGQNYPKRSGFCLEAQHAPDSPNQRRFPSVILRPGQTYRQTTIYSFGVSRIPDRVRAGVTTIAASATR